MLALAVAGSAGIGLTLPVTLAIVAMLAVLVICYRQVIAAYPDGGGAYTVARRTWGDAQDWWRPRPWSSTTCSTSPYR